MQESNPAPRRRSLAFRLSLAVGSALVALVLAELGLRAALAVRGSGYDAGAARLWITELVSRARDTIPMPADAVAAEGAPDDEVWGVPHPYVGWETNTGREILGHDIAHTRRGPGEPLRILVMGGSVAAIFNQLGASHLRRILQEQPELAQRKIQFRSYARGAYKQPQMLHYLTLLFSLGVEPDLVLEIDGFNEVALGSANFEAGVYPVWPSQIQWLPLVVSIGSRPELAEDYVRLSRIQDALVHESKAASTSPWMASALYGEWKLRSVRKKEAAFRDLSQRYVEALDELATEEIRGPTLQRGPLAAVVDVVRNWRESSRMMHLLCEARGVGYLHVLQPTLHDPGAKPMTAEEVEKGKIRESWLYGVEQGYPLLRQAGETLVTDGVPFLDLSRLFEGVEETLYYDLCHFTAPGNERMAEEIAPLVLELLREQGVVGAPR